MKKFLSLLMATLSVVAISCGGNKVQTVDSVAQDCVIDGVNDAAGFKIVDGTIVSENLPVLVDFYATWCGPCKAYSPIFHAVAERYKDVAIFLSIDIDEYPEIAENYGVKVIPTTAFIQTGGAEYGIQAGVIDETTLVSYVDQLVATTAGDDMGI